MLDFSVWVIGNPLLGWLFPQRVSLCIALGFSVLVEPNGMECDILLPESLNST